jgi:type I restriction enzyme S subunit
MIDRSYLAFYLRSPLFLSFATSNVQGANLPRLSLRALWEHQVPVPPLSEQRRIVARIQECLARVKEIETLQGELAEATDAAVASALAAIFLDVEARHPSATINDVTIDSGYGTNQRCSASGPGLPVLRIPNIQPGRIDLSDLKYAELPPREQRKVLLSPGDLLIVRTNGSPSLVGRCAVFEEDGQFGYASYLIRFRLRRDACIPAYLSFYLASTTGRDAIARIRRTSAGQFNINSENLRSIRFPLPSLEEQARLVESMTSISLTVRRLRGELVDNSVSPARLRDSILERAFAGEL